MINDKTIREIIYVFLLNFGNLYFMWLVKSCSNMASCWFVFIVKDPPLEWDSPFLIMDKTFLC